MKGKLLLILIAVGGLVAGTAQARDDYRHGHKPYHGKSHHRRSDYPRYRNQDPIRLHNRYYRNGRHKDKGYRYRDYDRNRHGYDYRGERRHKRYYDYGKHRYSGGHRNDYGYSRGHDGHHGHYHRRHPLRRIARRLQHAYFHCPDHGGYYRHSDLYYYD